MYNIIPTAKGLLPDVAVCHCACFPASLSTRMGYAYVKKSLEWFLADEYRFLFHIKHEGKVIGYCGGFVPQRIGDGSSSGMLQHAFSEALKGIAKKPWLLLHNEVVQQYSFLWRNIRRKITGKLQPAPTNGQLQTFKPYVGLVVIGVHPQYQGSGVARQLLNAFEEKVKMYEQHEMVLSVKKNNVRAIKAYEKCGWNISAVNKDTLLMRKII